MGACEQVAPRRYHCLVSCVQKPTSPEQQDTHRMKETISEPGLQNIPFDKFEIAYYFIKRGRSNSKTWWFFNVLFSWACTFAVNTILFIMPLKCSLLMFAMCFKFFTTLEKNSPKVKGYQAWYQTMKKWNFKSRILEDKAYSRHWSSLPFLMLKMWGTFLASTDSTIG